MKMQKKFVYATLSAALAGMVALSGCTSSEPTTTTPAANQATGEKVDGGDIIWGATGEPSVLNPFFAADTASSDVYNLVLEGLYVANQKLEAEPKLADGMPEVSSDNLVWTIKLQKDVKFSDGEPLTADDVVFTFSLTLKDDYAGPHKTIFSKLKSVEKVDDHTVKFTLKEPYAPFQTWALIYPILPEHILKDVPVKDMAQHDFSRNPVGTGPFKFAEWKSGQYVKVVRNENYWRGKPSVNSITYKVVPDGNALVAQLQAGEVNMLDVSPNNVKTVQAFADSSKKVALQNTVGLAYTYVGWNAMNPLFEDKKVRQALTLAIDRQAIVDAVVEGQGQVANSPVSSLSWAYNDKVPTFNYDVTKSKQLLAEAGWKDTDGDGILDKNGKKFSFELQTNQGNKVREQIATVMQQQLKQVGIELKPRMVEFASFINQYVRTKKFDAILLGWSMPVDPDPTLFWHSRESEKGLNYVAYNNPEVDKLLEANTKTLDQAQRKEMLGKVQEMIAEDQPYTFLFYPKFNTAYPGNLAGVEYGPAGLTYNVHKWHFTK